MDTEKWVPQCDKNGNYMRKQCDDEVCWCVSLRQGTPKYKKLNVPLGEVYNCTSESLALCKFELYKNPDVYDVTLMKQFCK